MDRDEQQSRLEKVFLNERFMAVVCIFMTATGLVSLIFCLAGQKSFETFVILTKLVTAVVMFFAFRSFKWDAAKGLMGGVLFCQMYQEAHLTLAELWQEQNFDVYLVSGVQGSLFLAGAGMNLLMTIIITFNHFFINYSIHGNPKNVILNRIALVFKLGVCILLVAAGSQLNFSKDIQWLNLLQYLTDILLMLLVACLEAQFDSFNLLRRMLRIGRENSEAEEEDGGLSIRERISGIWLMAMNLVALFAFTCYFVAQMWLNILRMVYLALVILPGLALIIFMWGPDKLKFKWQKLIYRLFYAASFFVLPAFLFIFMGLISQYHVRIKESIPAVSMAAEELLPMEKSTVYDTGTVYVIFPEYSDVNLVCETRPSKSDKSITWCSGAAFQHTVSLGFSQENVEGDHAVQGTLYESPYNWENFAAFTCVDGEFSFEFDNPSDAVRAAAEAGGSGFMQFGLIRNGETIMGINRPRARCYRTLAELNGNLCIIDSGQMMQFEDFMEELERIGVTNALYMDMGAGWNYSWYRDAADKVVTLFGLPVPWSHNWVVFKK